MSQYLASLRAVNRSSGKCNTLSCDGPWQVYNTSRWYKQPSLLMAGNNDDYCMSRSLNVTPKGDFTYLAARQLNIINSFHHEPSVSGTLSLTPSRQLLRRSQVTTSMMLLHPYLARPLHCRDIRWILAITIQIQIQNVTQW